MHHSRGSVFCLDDQNEIRTHGCVIRDAELDFFVPVSMGAAPLTQAGEWMFVDTCDACRPMQPL